MYRIRAILALVLVYLNHCEAERLISLSEFNFLSINAKKCATYVRLLSKLRAAYKTNLWALSWHRSAYLPTDEFNLI